MAETEPVQVTQARIKKTFDEFFSDMGDWFDSSDREWQRSDFEKAKSILMHYHHGSVIQLEENKYALHYKLHYAYTWHNLDAENEDAALKESCEFLGMESYI